MLAIPVAGLHPEANNVSAGDLTCAICLSIFIEPVLLPCGHGFCRSCFHGNVTFNSLCCPLCRKRFGNWLRKAGREKTLVNGSLWSFVQRNFAQLQKEHLSLTDNAPGPERASDDGEPSHASQTGAIRKEFELQYELFQRELANERQHELKVTQEFIVKLLEEELNALQSNLPRTSPPVASHENMLVANPGHTPYTLTSTKGANNLSGIQSEIKKNAIPSLSNSKAIAKSSIHHHSAGSSGSSLQSAPSSTTAVFLAQTAKCNLIKSLAVRLNRGTDIIKQSVHKVITSKIPQTFLSGASSRELLTVPPTSTHREPNSSVNSTDSLRLEMCYFKPIRTVPTTPNKKSHEDTLRTPKAKRLPKTHMSKCNQQDSSDTEPSLLQHSFKPSRRKSAFSLVGASPSHGDSTACDCRPPTLIKATRRKNSNLFGSREKQRPNCKNPVVLMKRINASKSKTKPLPGTAGRVVQTSGKVEPSRRNGIYMHALQEDNCNESKTIEEDRLEKLIKEQKRCEERIEQEKLDYEMAKKLQTELNVELANPFVRKNLRKRRNQAMCDQHLLLFDSDSEAAQEAGPSMPPTKNCRRTCGRILSFKETEAVETATLKKTAASRVKCDKTSQHLNTTSLRRSVRKTKPTNRYIV